MQRERSANSSCQIRAKIFQDVPLLVMFLRMFTPLRVVSCKLKAHTALQHLPVDEIARSQFSPFRVSGERRPQPRLARVLGTEIDIVRSLILRTRTWNSSSLHPARAISITIHPGATALTVTPRRPSSIAKRRVRINTSALVAA